MLGLGRALGETIAVALILSAVFTINWQITEPGGNTFAANIALKWGEAGDVGRSALIASGLVLFLITLGVNMVARWIIARRKDFSGAN
jgi:phosphate transport system permease protein